MKNISIILLAALLFTSCKIEMSNDSDEGAQVTKVLNLKDFNSIGLTGCGEIEFTQDSVYKVELIGTEKALSEIHATIEDSTLNISKRSFNNTGDGKHVWRIKSSDSGYKVKISAPDLHGIYVAGSGTFEAKTPIHSKEFNAAVTGSGDIDLGNVTAGNIKITISGSGCVEAKDIIADYSEMGIAGSGDISTGHIKCTRNSTYIMGSGVIESDIEGCNAVGTSINGSGTIDLKLKACGTVDANVSGSGVITLTGNAKELKGTDKGVDADDLTIGK